MSDIDERRERLRAAYAASSAQLPLTLGEADVRAKIIDPLLLGALGWPEDQIRREQYTTGGDFIDYSCGQPRRFLLVEAKRVSANFQFPQQTISASFSLAGLMRQDSELSKAIAQVAGYCQDDGIPYAAVTNGEQLVVFKAVRIDRPWRKGQAVVFRTPEEILERFDQLWDLLSYPAVRAGSLEAFFAFPDETPRQYKSVISTLPNPDERLIRNELHSDLIPILRAVFEDLTETQHAAVLERCYVPSPQLQATADDFIITIKDLPPTYLHGQIEHMTVQTNEATPIQIKIEQLAAERRRGTVLLLLGGVGAGKTTFLTQVRAKYCAKTIDESGAYFYVDFRAAPRTPPFEAFVYGTIREQLNTSLALRETLVSQGVGVDSSRPLLDQPAVLTTIFKDELFRVEDLARTLGSTDTEAIAKQKLARLTELTGNDSDVVARAFRYIETAGRFILLALDNADQHELQYQLSIFLFAQNVAGTTGANIICALREEKYYLASQRGAFNAFHTHLFHIPSPRLKDLLAQRLSYAEQHLDELLSGANTSRIDDVRVFLDAISRGGVGLFGRRGSSNVVRLLERTCMGDMRRALKLFRRFMQSGNTNVRKILNEYRDSPSHRVTKYFVPFHEFTKSVMLDDRRYYREGETEDEVVNLFHNSGHAPNSHFTSLRVLAMLMESSERKSRFGPGYLEWAEVVGNFEAIFADSTDVRLTLEKLLFRSLIESDTGVSTVADGSVLDSCQAVRATASGEYYLTFLARAFAYLDLVWVDTPLADTATLAVLNDLVDARDLTHPLI